MLALRRTQRLALISMGPRAARLPRFVARVYAWQNRKLHHVRSYLTALSILNGIYVLHCVQSFGCEKWKARHI